MIVITSASLFTNSTGWVAGFGGMLTMSIALGRKSSKQINVDGKIITQHYLQVTISIDHDIINGAPAARFISTLVKHIETGFGLDFN